MNKPLQILVWSPLIFGYWGLLAYINADSVYKLFADSEESIAIYLAAAVAVLFLVVLLAPFFEDSKFKTIVIYSAHLISAVLTSFTISAVLIASDDKLENIKLDIKKSKASAVSAESNKLKPITVDITRELDQIKRLSNKDGINTRGDRMGTVAQVSNNCDMLKSKGHYINDYVRLVSSVRQSCQSIHKIKAKIARLKSSERAGNIADSDRQIADSAKNAKNAHDERLSMQPTSRLIHDMGIGVYIKLAIGFALGFLMDMILKLLVNKLNNIVNPPPPSEVDDIENDSIENQTTPDGSQVRRSDSSISRILPKAYNWMQIQDDNKVMSLLANQEVPAKREYRESVIEVFKLVCLEYEKEQALMGISKMFKHLKQKHSNKTFQVSYKKGTEWIKKPMLETWVYPMLLEIGLIEKANVGTRWANERDIEEILSTAVDVMRKAA